MQKLENPVSESHEKGNIDGNSEAASSDGNLEFGSFDELYRLDSIADALLANLLVTAGEKQK